MKLHDWNFTASKQSNKCFQTTGLSFSIGGLIFFVDIINKYPKRCANPFVSIQLGGGGAGRPLDWINKLGGSPCQPLPSPRLLRHSLHAPHHAPAPLRKQAKRTGTNGGGLDPSRRAKLHVAKRWLRGVRRLAVKPSLGHSGVKMIMLLR